MHICRSGRFRWVRGSGSLRFPGRRIRDLEDLVGVRANDHKFAPGARGLSLSTAHPLCAPSSARYGLTIETHSVDLVEGGKTVVGGSAVEREAEEEEGGERMIA